jgi:hypothetical protein
VGLDCVLPGSLSDQVDGLVDSSQWRHVDGLLSDNTTSTDSGRIFSGTGLKHGTNENLQRVSGSEEVNNLEGVPDDTDGFDFLTSVASVELH